MNKSLKYLFWFSNGFQIPSGIANSQIFEQILSKFGVDTWAPPVILLTIPLSKLRDAPVSKSCTAPSVPHSLPRLYLLACASSEPWSLRPRAEPTAAVQTMPASPARALTPSPRARCTPAARTPRAASLAARAVSHPRHTTARVGSARPAGRCVTPPRRP